MAFKPTVTQRHVLYWLLFTGNEPPMSKTEPKLQANQRKELINAGLIVLEKRGRARHIIITDKGWAWIADHLDDEIPRNLKLVSPALEALLKKIKDYMTGNNVSLAEILRGKDKAEKEIKDKSVNIEDRISSVYYELAGREWNTRVRLSDLRAALHETPRNELDATLRKMQLDNRYSLVLYPYDDPREIKHEDDEAAIDIAGTKNHILYIGG